MKRKTDREQHGLTGAVQSVHTEIASISEKQGKWVISSRQSEVITTYNRQGKMTRQTFNTDNTGTRGIELLPDSNVVKHDTEGNIIECLHYIMNVLESKVLYTYDKQGRKIEENAYSPKSELYHKTVYKYDERDKVIEMITYDASGRLCTKHTYANEYDSVGNLTKVTVRRWTNIKEELFYQPLCEIYYSITYY